MRRTVPLAHHPPGVHAPSVLEQLSFVELKLGWVLFRSSLCLFNHRKLTIIHYIYVYMYYVEYIMFNYIYCLRDTTMMLLVFFCKFQGTSTATCRRRTGGGFKHLCWSIGSSTIRELYFAFMFTFQGFHGLMDLGSAVSICQGYKLISRGLKDQNCLIHGKNTKNIIESRYFFFKITVCFLFLGFSFHCIKSLLSILSYIVVQSDSATPFYYSNTDPSKMTYQRAPPTSTFSTPCPCVVFNLRLSEVRSWQSRAMELQSLGMIVLELSFWLQPVILLYIPYHPCMVYIPAFGCF